MGKKQYKSQVPTLGPTSHPDGLLGPAVVPAGTLGGHQSARGRLEAVPPGLEVAVADRGDRGRVTQGQVVVERPLRLVPNHNVVTLKTRVNGLCGCVTFGSGCGCCGGG